MTSTKLVERPAPPGRTQGARILSLRRAPIGRIAASAVAGVLAAGGAYAGIVAQLSGSLTGGHLAWTLFAAASSGVFAFLTTMAGGYAIRALRLEEGRVGHQDPAAAPGRLWGSVPPRNPDFTDRDRTLTLIGATLAGRPDATDPRSCALVGLGGVGKSTVAAEFAYRARSEYAVVWWIRAEQEATIVEDLGALAAALHAGGSDDSLDVISRVRQGLMQRSPWLLVFDNAESQSGLRNFWPGGSTGSVLLTSRQAVWDGLATATVGVDVFEPADAIALLERRSGRVDDPYAAKVVERLGRLPLALAHAGSYVSKTGTSLRRYDELIEGRAGSVLSAPLQGDNATSVATTWTVSFEAASRQASGARELLVVCAFLNPTEIPRWLLAAHADELPEPLASVARDPVAYDLAIAAQAQYSLLTADEDWLGVHRLVQFAVRDSLTSDEQRIWAGVALTVVDRAFPDDPVTRARWALCGELISHVLAVTDHVHRLGMDSSASGQLTFRAGQYLVERGAYGEAADVLRRALDLLSTTDGPESLPAGNVSRLLAHALLRNADLPNATTMAERALTIHERRLGPDDPELVGDLVELGRIYREVSRLDESKSILERALALAEAGNTTEVPLVLQQFASTAWRIGHLGEARALLERALTFTGPGTNDVSTREAATIQRTLGVVARDLRDLPAARTHFEASEALFVAADGPDSVLAVRVRHAECDVLALAGEAAEAYDRINPVIERLVAIYGPDHPNVAEALRTQGSALNGLGRPAEAEPILTRCVSIYEKIYGPAHPYVAEPLVPLAASYRLSGDAARAQAAIDRARSIVVASYQPDHPAYAVILEELSRQRAAAGDAEAAATLAAEADSIWARAGRVSPHE
jgi:tetratricopeptide (TPR) repeat protein